MRSLAGLLCVVVVGCGSESSYVDDLTHPSAERRVAAAEFLGAQREGSAVAALVDALGDSEPGVRAKSAWALGMIRDSVAMHPLIDLLDDGDREVKQASLGALMNLEQPDALPALGSALSKESDDWVVGDLEKTIRYLEQFEGEADVGESSFR